jgi:hypothetical protein
MARLKTAAVVLFMVLTLAPNAFSAGDETKLTSGSGNLLRGIVYKHTGVSREGIITIKTSWKLPANPPVFRYDFDILFGRIENNLHQYFMGDVTELEFLPIEEGEQPVNVKLRNGLIQKIVFSSDRKGILGKVNLMIDEVYIVTDGYGQNIVAGGDVSRIVLLPPMKPGEETIGNLTELFGKALQVGGRDDLVDDNFMIILKNIQKKMKDKAYGEIEKKD